MSVKKMSEKTKEDANKIAKGIQRPKQTKEQTKLIAQGIQKGIELYKKQHKEKLRKLDRQKKKATPVELPPAQVEIIPPTKLAWRLLIATNTLWLLATSAYWFLYLM